MKSLTIFFENVVDTEPKVDKREEKAQRKREKVELKAKKKKSAKLIINV